MLLVVRKPEPVDIQSICDCTDVNCVDVAVEIGLFKSLVLLTLLNPTIDFVIPETVPVKVGLFIFAFNPIWFKTVVAKLGSSPKASANSCDVSNVAGTKPTNDAICVST